MIISDMLINNLAFAEPTLLLFTEPLGFLPSEASYHNLPKKKNDTWKGKILINVPPLILLHLKNHKRPSNGARPSHRIHHHNLHDGRVETNHGEFLFDSISSSSECFSVPSVWSGCWHPCFEPNFNHHTWISHHTLFPSNIKLFCSVGVNVYCLD